MNTLRTLLEWIDAHQAFTLAVVLVIAWAVQGLRITIEDRRIRIQWSGRK